MRFADIARMCFDNLKRRKGRTILTVLGVFIGCTSIVVMVSIGLGMSESNDQMLSEMGDLTIIEVNQGYGESGSEEAVCNDDAVETFRAIDGVVAVMPKASMGGYSVSMRAGINDRYYCEWCEIVGLDVDAMEAMGYEILDGKISSSGRDEMIAGQWLAYNFYDSLMPEGRNYVDRWANYDGSGDMTNAPDPYFNILNTPITLEFTIDDGMGGEGQKIRHEMKVTGITKEDYGKGWETSEGIMMSIDTMKALMKKFDGNANNANKLTYSSISVKVEDISLVSEVEAAIKEMGYYTYSMESMRESMEESSRRIQFMLGGLGAISLFVAAIGITNTMIMSISERTREIGIMKALGCYVRDIRMLFLMEAGAIGMMGGILGCVVSLLLSAAINLVSMGVLDSGQITAEILMQSVFGGEGVSRISVVSVGLLIFGVTFSILVGLVSGYYPANRAVKIPALEAIKHE